MARKPKRRFNLRKVRATGELALATLASDTAIAVGLTGASVNPYRLQSINATWGVRALTAGEGPVTIGIAHSDYSVTEIKECLEATSSIDLGNKVEQERSNRLVRVIGTVLAQEPMLNDGKPIRTKLNWLISVGFEADMFAYNEFTGALTTGAVVHMSGDLWVKDAQ